MLAAGITTVVGILGADATTRTLSGVLGKVREFSLKGMTGLMYTGAMQTPPPTLTGSIVDDLILIPEVIGLGEVAIADMRSTEPSLAELARWVSQAYLGGNTGGKAGITRFHIGEGRRGLGLLNDLLDHYDIPPRCLHPTHVTRTKELIPQAVALAKRGCYVDTDTVEEGTARLFVEYLKLGRPPERFTFSSDAQTPGGFPEKLFHAFQDCVLKHYIPLEKAIPHFSLYTAAALRLTRKGTIREGADADLLLLDKKTLEVRQVIARGSVVMRDGVITNPEN